MMNTAMKLIMSNNWIKMAPAEDEPMPGAGGDEDTVVEETGGDDLDWLFEDGSEKPEKEPVVKEESVVEEEGTPKEEEEEPEVVEEPVKEEPVKEEEQVKKEESVKEEMTPEKLAELKENFRAELEKQFAISDDDANLLVTAPEKVLPRLASNIAIQIMEQVQLMQNQFVQSLPNMMQQAQVQTSSEAAMQAKFMETTPELSQLNQKDLEAAIFEFAPIIKKRFPDLSVDERLAKLGTLIKTTYGLKAVAPKKETTPRKQPPKPHTPTAPARSSVPAGQQPRSQLQTEIDELLNSDD